MSAVLRLITKVNFVGCSTGKSLGFEPLKILSTKVPPFPAAPQVGVAAGRRAPLGHEPRVKEAPPTNPEYRSVGDY